VSSDRFDRWRIYLFGELQVTSPDGSTHRITSRKAAELLVFLTLRKRRQVERDIVADALWPEIDLISARNRLKQTLSVLRREVPGLPVSAIGKTQLELDAERVQIDVHVYDERLKWLPMVGGARRAGAIAELWSEISKGLVPGLSTDWLVADQAKFRTTAEGLKRQLDEAEATRSLPFVIGSLPPDSGVPIIGRDAELLAVQRWLREGSGRQLCILGAPGSGKTRLLSETIERCRPDCDGVVFLSFRKNPEPSLEELSVRGTDLFSGFNDPLLAIDDCDLLSDSDFALIGRLLARFPRLRVLATTTVRQPGFDREVRLAPLDRASSKRLLGAFCDLTAEDELIAAVGGIPGLAEAVGRMAAETGRLPPADRVVRITAPGRPSYADSVTDLVGRLSRVDKAFLRLIAVAPAPIDAELGQELSGESWDVLFSKLVDVSLCVVQNGAQVPLPISACIGPLDSGGFYEACVRFAEKSAAGLATESRAKWLKCLAANLENLAFGLKLAPEACQTNKTIELIHELACAINLVSELSVGELLAEVWSAGKLAETELTPAAELALIDFGVVFTTIERRQRLRERLLPAIAARSWLHEGRTDRSPDSLARARELFQAAGRVADARAAAAEAYQETNGNRQFLDQALAVRDAHAAGLYALKLARFMLDMGADFDAGAFAETAGDQFRLAAEPLLEREALTILISAVERQGDLDRLEELRAG
jgi:hypothetical protein